MNFVKNLILGPLFLANSLLASPLVQAEYPFSEPGFKLEQFGTEERAIEHIARALKQHPFLQCSKEGNVGSLRDQARNKLIKLTKAHPKSYETKLLTSEAEAAFADASKTADLVALDNIAFHFPHTPQAKEAISMMIAIYLDAYEFTLASLLSDKLKAEWPELNFNDHLRMMSAHCRVGEFKKANETYAVISNVDFEKSSEENERLKAVDANCKENYFKIGNRPQFADIFDSKSQKLDYYLRAIRLIGADAVLSGIGVPPPFLKEACFILQVAVLDPRVLSSPNNDQMKTLSLFEARRVPIFLELMRSADPEIARVGLISMGEKAIIPLLKAFDEPDFPEPVARFIPLLGPKAMKALANLASHGDPLVRKRVAYAYGAATILEEDDLRALMLLAGDLDSTTHAHVITPLASANGLAPHILRALSDASPQRRQSAAQLIGLQLSHEKPGYDTKEMNDAIRVGLADSAPDVRKVLIGSLLQKKDKIDFIPDFIRLLGDPEEDVRDMASRFLGELGSAAVPAVVEATKTDSNIARLSATKTLAALKDLEFRVGKSFLNQAAHHRMLELTDDSDADVRIAAIGSYFGTNHLHPLPVENLIRGLQSTHPGMQMTSLHVLSQHDNAAEAIPQIKRLTSSKILAVRNTAETLLKVLRTKFE